MGLFFWLRAMVYGYHRFVALKSTNLQVLAFCSSFRACINGYRILCIQMIDRIREIFVC